ncbi:hypothetical protein THRCLA_07313 [Thraustotheca clavata]|uniref:TMEM131 second Ig-like domain-containing protein n=1 Tax=Thraustotheca clavata TaxID=74557 RepID=A0A1V9ZEA3_9STRA|nr:hypothetical protein THRCLA_07313 [Thraustotheca clavata]
METLDYQELYASVMAYEALNTVPKPYPRKNKVGLLLGGAVYEPKIQHSLTFEAAPGRGRDNNQLLHHYALSTNIVKQERDIILGDTIVRVQPSQLDFGLQMTCVPNIYTMEINHVGTTEPEEYDEDNGILRINGIELHDVHFLLAGTFNPVALKPGEHVKLHVIFLPRIAGLIQSSLTVYTSRGKFRYDLLGEGKLNFYALESHSSVLPIGVQHKQSIQMHNPLSQVLEISEIFSAEDYISTDFPQFVGESPWVLQPNETKDVVQLTFRSTEPGMHHSFMRINTYNEKFIVPLDFDVLADSLHISQKSIDLGFLTSDEERHHVALDIVNSAKVPILIQGVSLQVADPFISVIIQGSHVIAPRTRVKNALILTYQTSVAGTVAGALTLHTNFSAAPDLALQYTAARLMGSLGHSNCTNFYLSMHTNTSKQSIVLQNNFDRSLQLSETKVLDERCRILSVPLHTIASPGSEWPPIMIECSNSKQVNVETLALHIETNATKHIIPLTLYHGNLVVENSHLVQESKSNRTLLIDFGNISLASAYQEILNLSNTNPEPIAIQRIEVYSDAIKYSLQSLVQNKNVLLSVGRASDTWRMNQPGYGSQFMIDATSEFMAKVQLKLPLGDEESRSLLELAPGYLASLVFRFRPEKNGMDSLAFTIVTDTESIHVHIKYSCVEGSITPFRPKIRLPMMYPGKAEEISLMYKSTFAHPVPISAIRVSDRRMQIISGNNILQPNAVTEVAKVVVSPAYALACSNRDKFADCMVPYPIGHKSPLLSTFGQFVAPIDIEAYHDRIQRYVQLQTSGQTLIEMKIMLYTDLVTIPSMLVRMPMGRPRLTDGTLVIPLTHICNSSEVYVQVSNPSNMTIHIGLAVEREDTDNGVFICSTRNDTVCAALWKEQRELHPFMLSQSSMDKKSLEPGATVALGPISFAPGQAKEYVGRIYLRNTLSHIEPIVLRGFGGEGKAFVENGQDEITFSDFQSRTITIANMGELPLDLLSIRCNDCICSGDTSGFCIQWKNSTTLGTNERSAMEISYKPSCYYTKEDVIAELLTSSGPVLMHLVGKITDPYKCLVSKDLAWYTIGFKWAIWLCFALVVGQMLIFTSNIIYSDLQQFPLTVPFGYDKHEMVGYGNVTSYQMDDISIETQNDMDAIEREIQSAWSFSVVRRPAVQKLLERRSVVKEKQCKVTVEFQPEEVIALQNEPSTTSVRNEKPEKLTKKKKEDRQTGAIEHGIEHQNATDIVVTEQSLNKETTMHCDVNEMEINEMEVVHKDVKILTNDVDDIFYVSKRSPLSDKHSQVESEETLCEGNFDAIVIEQETIKIEDDTDCPKDPAEDEIVADILQSAVDIVFLDSELDDDYATEIFKQISYDIPVVEEIRGASNVKAPPGFSPLDADPTAVSLTYSQLEVQERLISLLESELIDDDHWNTTSLDDTSNAFQAPLSLFGSSYFTGGLINSGSTTSRLAERFKTSELAFESSKDVFLGSESAMEIEKQPFSFW